MHRLTKLILFFTFSVLVLTNCEKDNPVKTSDDPVIWINKSEMQLSGDPWRDRFDIANTGKGLLKWYVDSSPEWIFVSIDSGYIDTDTISVNIFTDYSQLDYGEHSGDIVITSNAGSVTLTLNLNYAAPVMKLNEEVFNMDRYVRTKELVIMNTGGGELHWRVASTPAWLSTGQWEGTVRSSQTINFWLDLNQTDYGQYEDELIIESDGGTVTIACYLLYQREIEVFPGIGAALMEIGDTVLMLKNQYGNPTSNGYDRPEKTVFLHFLIYKYHGLKFWFTASQPNLWDSVDMDKIEMMPPYDGLTEEGIGLGSSFDEVKAAYGEPSSYDSENDLYVYDIGIKFEILNNIVNRMIID